MPLWQTGKSKGQACVDTEVITLPPPFPSHLLWQLKQFTHKTRANHLDGYFIYTCFSEKLRVE